MDTPRIHADQHHRGRGERRHASLCPPLPKRQRCLLCLLAATAKRSVRQQQEAKRWASSCTRKCTRQKPCYIIYLEDMKIQHSVGCQAVQTANLKILTCSKVRNPNTKKLSFQFRMPNKVKEDSRKATHPSSHKSIFIYKHCISRAPQ